MTEEERERRVAALKALGIGLAGIFIAFWLVPFVLAWFVDT